MGVGIEFFSSDEKIRTSDWVSCFFNRPEELAVSTRARSAHKSSGGWQEFPTFQARKKIKHNHNTPHPFLHETGGGGA